MARWTQVAVVTVGAAVLSCLLAPADVAEPEPHVPLPIVDTSFSTSTQSSPTITFEDNRALADYVVRLRRDLSAIEMALERDIHAGEAFLPYTHEVIDGQDLDGNGLVGE